MRATRVLSLKITVLIVLIASLTVVMVSVAGAVNVDPIYVVELEGTITAGQNSFLQRQVEKALEMDAQLFVLVMNTPGGLVDATMEINRLFLNARIPIAVLVAPSGAIAGSAGAFVLISSDIAAMAPGTTVGAAQPIAISPEGAGAADEKTTLFYASHMRSMAREKGRPEDIAARFVTENLTLGAREALESGIIEYLAADLPDLLLQVDGLEIEKLGLAYSLNTASAVIHHGEMNLREALQNWLSNPQIAFFVLMLGFMGIYFGISAPGTIVPEVAGAILVVMGIYGIGLFDTNTTGIVMLLLGLGLIVAEILTSGFGVLGIGGIVSMAIGAVLLPTEPLMARDWYATFLVTTVGTILGFAVILFFVAHSVIRSRRQLYGGSTFFHPPQKGVVVVELRPDGVVRARGELWKARSDGGATITVGTAVEVLRVEALTLWVQPAQERTSVD